MISFNLTITNPFREVGYFNLLKKVDRKWFNKLAATFQVYKNTLNLLVVEVQFTARASTIQLGLAGYHSLFRVEKSQ